MFDSTRTVTSVPTASSAPITGAPPSEDIGVRRLAVALPEHLTLPQSGRAEFRQRSFQPIRGSRLFVSVFHAIARRLGAERPEPIASPPRHPHDHGFVGRRSIPADDPFADAPRMSGDLDLPSMSCPAHSLGPRIQIEGDDEARSSTVRA